MVCGKRNDKPRKWRLSKYLRLLMLTSFCHKTRKSMESSTSAAALQPDLATGGGAVVEMSAVALSKAIHGRELSCLEVLDAYCAQIDRLNPVVNALVAPLDRDWLRGRSRELDTLLARGQSLGPLHGFRRRPRTSCRPQAWSRPRDRRSSRTSCRRPIAWCSSACAQAVRSSWHAAIRPSSAWAAIPTTRSTGPRAMPSILRDRQAAAAGRAWPWRCACCPWPMART